MDEQNKNLILATVLSFLVIMVWFWFFPPEDPALTQAPPQTTEAVTDATVPTAATDPSTTAVPDTQTDPVADAPRVAIETPEFSGSLSLLGGRIDDLKLTQYRETLDENAETVRLFKPVGEPNAYFALFGWAGAEGIAADAVPGPDTLWTLESGETLTPDSPVTLAWDNGAGQIFRTTISVDEDFMFDFAQSVENATSDAVTLRPYGLIRRHGEPTDLKNFFILHEGLVRFTDGELEEVDYDDIVDYEVDDRERTRADRIEATESGWIGYTDHYWMTTLIPEQGQPFRSTSKYFEARDLYQAEAVMPLETVAAGATTTVTTKLFAGAKEWDAIRDYENEDGVTSFLDSIDWGWFFFLTKPIFWLLHTLNVYIGNMGWSIVVLTLIIKAMVLPLAYKSYVSMAKMKELQPEMEALKERTGEDKQAMQQGMMKLYKENKVNPASGCLPILLQIPIFFSLYKVIFVTIELRHAPWIGWIKDLSAPDPSSIFNFYGLLPWDAPEPGSILALLFIGLMPLALGISMWLQQKLNPPMTDPTQKMIFAWMPWVFMFMLGSFASGLVLYWIANNMITFTQQYLIMRSHGAKPDIFGNIKAGFKKDPKPANATGKPSGKAKPKSGSK
ncbi:membrane protein insertase YidC [Yoonia sp. 208BN28-4]|uniref:membrane protein insertase YidC n=1 Tax=Yoonia sp. 208BN28-4 TaxID=3126505 RepID=UPI0030974209